MDSVKLLIGLLLLSVRVVAQDFYEETVIQTIEITFTESNWDQLLDDEKAGDDGYIMAESVLLNGTFFDSVGVKYKGNSSYNPNQTKNPFHIELNTFKDQDYQGYKDIKLSNVAKDPSFLREVLSYKILRQYMDAPKSNYANVYVNGTHLGLYTNSEAISKAFLEDRFQDKNNTFVKCNPPAGAGPGTSDYPNLEYLGTDSLLYYDAYEMKSDDGWFDLIHLCDSIENHLSDIESILDVDRALYMIAFDNILVNLDSYIGGFTQNYYLYKDDYNKFLPIVWDLNESFGQFSMTGTGFLTTTTSKQQLDHLLHENDNGFPLIQQLLSVPLYKRMYLAHCKTILLENFDSGQYYTDGLVLQTLIDDAVNADQNKFFTYANFTSNLTDDVSTGGGPGGGITPGITNLMDGRSVYLLAQTDFMNAQPTISNIVVSNTSPSLNETITITAEITNETDVYLGTRSAEPAHFQRVLMYDDGLHNDGGANDGVYGADVTITSLTLEYYIYADNNEIGLFSPARAEHEYYTITVEIPEVGDLVINELLASNDVSESDQDGEFDDWIELYNNGSEDILLDTLYLTDDVNDLTMWPFPSGSVIPAGGYYMIWADDDLTQSGVHANFKLSADGESLLLVSNTGTIVDQLSFLEQTTDVSYGRYANGIGAFQTMVPTYSSENTNVLSIEGIEDLSSVIRVYPNPAQSQFSVEIEGESDPVVIQIYDTYGKLLISDMLFDVLQVSTANWKSGVYYVHVKNDVIRVLIK